MEYVKDYKKEYKNLYVPKTMPTVVDVPEMLFVAVEGKGNPNLLLKKYSNGLASKRQERKILTRIMRDILQSKKDYVYSVCTLARMMTSR